MKKKRNVTSVVIIIGNDVSFAINEDLCSSKTTFVFHSYYFKDWFGTLDTMFLQDSFLPLAFVYTCVSFTLYVP